MDSGLLKVRPQRAGIRVICSVERLLATWEPLRIGLIFRDMPGVTP